MRGLPFFTVIFIFVTITTATTLTPAPPNDDDNLCKDIACRAGRECAIDESGEATCICIRDCPSHVHLVCGSNGKDYDNNCQLHKDACITQQHISVLHNGRCVRGENIDNDIQVNSNVMACFQEERDLLRQKIISWLQEVLKTDDVTRWTSSYFDLIWAEYYTCDANKDAYIDATELLDCMNVTINADREHADLLRSLCIDAVMAIADDNHDWKLNYSEFQNCMDPDFKAVNKQCQMLGKKYYDRDEVTVECNRCVCACGNWVCISTQCDDGNKFENTIS